MRSGLGALPRVAVVIVCSQGCAGPAAEFRVTADASTFVIDRSAEITSDFNLRFTAHIKNLSMDPAAVCVHSANYVAPSRVERGGKRLTPHFTYAIFEGTPLDCMGGFRRADAPQDDGFRVLAPGVEVSFAIRSLWIRRTGKWNLGHFEVEKGRYRVVFRYYFFGKTERKRVVRGPITSNEVTFDLREPDPTPTELPPP